MISIKGWLFIDCENTIAEETNLLEQQDHTLVLLVHSRY
jgi:hypothetical protein